MIKILTILPLVFLMGCTTVTSLLHLNTASFDTIEYQMATHLLATIKLSTSCTPEFINDIHAQSVELYLYSSATPGNADIAKMEDDLNKVVTELVNHSQPVNTLYCKDKLQILDRMSSSVQHVIGSKPR